jgi:hypothetical protein
VNQGFKARTWKSFPASINSKLLFPAPWGLSDRTSFMARLKIRLDGTSIRIMEETASLSRTFVGLRTAKKEL